MTLNATIMATIATMRRTMYAPKGSSILPDGDFEHRTTHRPGSTLDQTLVSRER